MLTEDWMMRQVDALARSIAYLVFQKESTGYVPAGAAEQGAVLHLQRRDKALQHPPRLRREVAGHMDEGGAVGLQQAAQQLRRNVGVQQQGHFSRF